MRDIVIPRHVNMKLAHPDLLPKSGMADYSTIYIESDFIRFPFLFDGEKSIPLVMYEELGKNNVKNYRLFSLDNGKLARKSIPLPLELRMKQKRSGDGESEFIEEDLNVYFLGKDILGYPTDSEEGYSVLEDEPDLFRDKIVVVGSLYGDDNHSTYAGDMPGSLILYNAYLSLIKGRHLLSIPLLILLFVIFFLISYSILIKEELCLRLDVKIKDSKKKSGKKLYKVIKRIVDSFAIEASLSVICVVIYLISGEIFDIIITGFYFILVSRCVKNIDKFKKIGGKLIIRKTKT